MCQTLIWALKIVMKKADKVCAYGITFFFVGGDKGNQIIM